MGSRPIFRWRRAHPGVWHVASLAAGVAVFVLLWALGAGTIALAAAVLYGVSGGRV